MARYWTCPRAARTAGFHDDGHGKGDTAQHTCPDGSDLGGGAKLIESKGAELNAVAAQLDSYLTQLLRENTKRVWNVYFYSKRDGKKT